MKEETLVEIVITMAKMGMKGDTNCKRTELEKRVKEKMHKITTNNFGIYGGKEAKFGVMVEFFSHLRVGITGGVGLMVYDGRKYEIDGERIALTRQFISDKEMEMMRRSTTGKQDYLVVAARGMINKAALDDVLRRSFKNYLEDEMKVKIHVWIMQMRHLDDRGKMRDEAIMIGMVAEGSGERLTRTIEVFKNGKKQGLLLVEGIDIQIFRDVKEVWNTMKPTTIGRAEKTVEVICPIGCASSTVLRVLEEGGVSEVCMLVRMKQPIGRSDEIWLAVLKHGERVKHRQVEWGNDRYVLIESKRPAESDKIEACCINYEKGTKQVAPMRTFNGGSEMVTKKLGGQGVNEDLSSITMSIGTVTTGDVSESMTNLGNDQRAIKAIKDIAEESKKETKELGRELREEMATIAKQLAEQNCAQDKARLEKAQRQNKTLEDLRNMIMIMMSSASAKTNV
jgi:hypothetical protein